MRTPFRIKRVWLRWISATSVVLFLFAQLTVAAYACPAFSKLSTAGAMVGSMVKPCPDTDPQRTSLCKEHCKGQTAIDHVGLPDVPPAIDTGITLPFLDVYPVIADAVVRFDLTRVTEPPPSIRFCVFRT